MAGAVTGRLLNGRYQIESLLGVGGMATVWRARDLRLDRLVAVKGLSGNGLRHASALQRFDLEARAVARLSHVNVVSVYDFGTEDGAPYLVMELVDGPTVAQLLNHGPLPVAEVLALAAQVCDGLGAAHAADIVHRDIKPANLMLTRGGVVKICDFGIARLLDRYGNAHITGPSTAMGSPSYMAPEQIAGGPVDRRADLYALGCTMYAMLAGRPPFVAGGPLGIVHEHLTVRPVPLRQHRPDVPPEVGSLIADLLAKRPEQRPPDAGDVRARIAATQTALAPVATAHPRPATSPPAAVSPPVLPLGDQDRPAEPGSGASRVKLPRWTILAAGVALLAALAAVAVAVLLGGGANRTAGVSAPTTAPAAGLAPSAVASSAPTGPSRGPGSRAEPGAGVAQTRASTQPPPPVDPVVALRQAIAQQVASGDLQPDAATELNHMVDDLTKTIASGNTGDVANKIKAIRAKLTTQHNERKLTDAGYLVLTNAVDQVAASRS